MGKASIFILQAFVGHLFNLTFKSYGQVLLLGSVSIHLILGGDGQLVWMPSFRPPTDVSVFMRHGKRNSNLQAIGFGGEP